MDLLLILLFASVAGFFAVRLYSELGKSEGGEAEAAELAARVRPVESARSDAPTQFTGPAAGGMEAIRRAEGSFHPETFTEGARQAYQMILAAFAEGDRDTLKSLLSPKVYEQYVAAIASREERGLRQVSDLVRLEKAEIEEASLNDGVAKVVVRFEAEIATGLTDADGAVVEGDPSRIGKSVEDWTFERRIEADDPTWFLARVKKV